MVQGKLQDDKALIMRLHIADSKNQENGEPIDISLAGAASPIIQYRGKMVLFSIQDMVAEAIGIIDEAIEKGDTENE